LTAVGNPARILCATMKVYFVAAFRWFLRISLHVCAVLAGLVVEAEAADLRPNIILVSRG